MFESKFTVGFSKLGADGKIRLSAIFDFIQDNTDFHLKAMKPVSEYFIKINAGLFVVSRQLDFIRLPVYGEKITVKTFTHECKNIYGGRNNLIYGEDGELCVKANSIGAFVDLTSGRPLKIPDEIIRQIPIEPKIDMEYLPRKVRLPDCELETLGSLKAAKYHIDLNKHVNNARFIDIAQEFMPDSDKALKRLMIEYKTPAPLGALINAEKYVYENKVVIRLFGDEAIFAVAEFSY